MKARTDSPVDLGTVLKRNLIISVFVSLLIMIAIGVFAFWKIAEEKRRNQLPPPAPVPPSERVTPPLELRGLVALPANSNVVFAIQPGPLLNYAVKTKQDPVELLTKNRIPASFLTALAKAGITLMDIDHIAGGLYVPDKNEEVRVAVVLVLRQMRDEAKFLEGLKAKPTPDGFDVQLDKFPVQMKRLSPTDWAFGLSAKDFGEGNTLSPAMRELIVSRVPNTSAIWAAASGEKWNEKPLLQLLGKDAIASLSKFRAAAFGYTFGEQPALHLAVRSTEAEQLRTRFKGLATGEGATAGGTDDWATLTRPIEPADIFSTVKRMLE